MGGKDEKNKHFLGQNFDLDLGRNLGRNFDLKSVYLFCLSRPLLGRFWDEGFDEGFSKKVTLSRPSLKSIDEMAE